jgi:hypothetical protein
MRLNRWLLGLMMGALCLSYAPAQVVFSFETPDLHGYADDADSSDDCDAVGWDNCWQITQSTDGVTDGSYSMRVKWPGGFRWLISSDVRDILPLLRTEQRLLLDITVPAGVSVPWANFIVAFNDDRTRLASDKPESYHHSGQPGQLHRAGGYTRFAVALWLLQRLVPVQSGVERGWGA